MSLSLCQCSDRATHLSTDALPVPRVEREEKEEVVEEEEVWRDGGMLWRAVYLSLSLALDRAFALFVLLCPPHGAPPRRFFSFARSPLHSRRLESLSG